MNSGRSPSVASRSRLPRVAFFTLTGCGGCVDSLLGRDDVLATLGTRARVVYLPQFSTVGARGPYDVVVVEGCVAGARDLERLREVRQAATTVVALGTCAVAGGLGRCGSSVGAAVQVDHVLGGCPVAPLPTLALLRAVLDRGEPMPLEETVCDECLRRGLPCVARSQGGTCLGASTRAGCGAACPAVGRGCIHCAGPGDAHDREGPAGDTALARLYVEAWGGGRT